MGKLIKGFTFCLVCFSISFATISWQTTHNGTSGGFCQLSSNKISVTVHPYYADVVEEAEISTLGSVSWGDSKTLEITGDFTLGKGTALRSMLLWNGKKILKAKLLLRADADSAYEQVVDRDKPVFVARDPALIEYMGNDHYRFKIYPVEIGGTRKIRILYSVPLQMSGDGPLFNVYTAFTLGAVQIPNQIPMEIFNSSATYDKCFIQHGLIKKTVQFGAIYSIPVSDLYNAPYYYSSGFSSNPIKIVPVVNSWNVGFNTQIESGELGGYYSAIIASIPDTIGAFFEEENLSESDVNIEAKISTGTKIYLSDMPGKNLFGAYIKSTSPWDSIISWTCYNNSTGAAIFTCKQKINCVSDSNCMLPLIWAAKYSLVEGNGALGALYGFIDSKMSLLALESDTLSKTIALQYQDQGVPALTAQEIIIKPSKKPAAPKENAIFESVTGVLKQVICKLDFQAIIANGMLHIQFTNKFNGVFKLLIVDASGRVVQKYTSSYLSGTKVSFLIPRGLKGLYLMQIEAGKEHLQKKLLLN
jgi:hypothetical protein